jgi:hypothetical protein
VHAHYLVADLATALGEAGIQAPTHPEIGERLEMLRRLFADDALTTDVEPPSVAEMVACLRDRANEEEE